MAAGCGLLAEETCGNDETDAGLFLIRQRLGLTERAGSM